MTIKFTNNALTRLASGINNSVTSATVLTGDGALFPTLGAGDYFYCTFIESGVIEIVKVTARTTDTFTMTRAQEGTTAHAFTTAASVELRPTMQSLYDLAAEREATITTLANTKGGTGQNSSAWSGLAKVTSGTWSAGAAGTDYVTPTGSETLTNKTLTAPVVNGGSVNYASVITHDVGGYTGSNVYNDGAWKFRGAAGSYAYFWGFDSGGLTLWTDTAASTGAGSAMSPSGRLNIALDGTTIFYYTVKALTFRQTKVAMGANNVDLATGYVFTKTFVAGAVTLTVSNVPATGTVASFIMDITNGGLATITWWAGLKWVGGTPPTLTAAGRDVLEFFTHDGGTTWNGFVRGLAMA